MNRNKLYSSLPRSFIKTPDGTFQRLIPDRKSVENGQNTGGYVQPEIHLAEIPPLPDSVIKRNKTGKRKVDRVSLTRSNNIENTFI